MKRTTLMAAVFAIAANIAYAQSASDGLVAGFQSEGFTRIEVKHGPTQTKIEAIRGVEKVEVVVDRATGTVISREVESIDSEENTSPGVFVSSRTEDFSTDDSSDDDDDSDDDGDDDSGSDDDDGDDNSGSGSDDGDDDSGSGHGGGDDSGSGHDGSGGSDD